MQNESSYNGGGKCQSTGFSIATYYSGGGASDIRILENNVNNRVIVAGGAGGSSNSYAFGGGESGGESTENGAGKAGTSCIKDDDCPPGSFWYGGNASTKGNGGWWYGGASGNSPAAATAAMTWGGSSFVLTMSTYKSSVSNSYKFKGNTKCLLQNTQLIACNKEILSPSGGYETGDGAAKITKVIKLKIPLCTIKTCLHKNRKVSVTSINHYFFISNWMIIDYGLNTFVVWFLQGNQLFILVFLHNKHNVFFKRAQSILSAQDW